MKLLGNLLFTSWACSLLACLGAAQCDVVWSNEWSNWTSYAAFANPDYQSETADDFDFIGPVTRLLVKGKSTSVLPPEVFGATVRFYEWTTSGPGELLTEYEFGAADPGFAFSPIPGTLDITLPEPFIASGLHFFSVQLDLGGGWFGGNWYWWAANLDQVDLLSTYRRENTGPWLLQQPSGSTDLSFVLYSVGDFPPQGQECGTWFEVPSKAYVSDHNILRDVAVIASDDVWAIGESRVSVGSSEVDTAALTMHWDGSSWSTIPAPHPVPFPGFGWVDLEGISALASDDVWAGGSQRMAHPIDGFIGQQAFVIRWDGRAWIEIPTPITPAGCTGAGVDGIHAVASDDVWFVGTTCSLQGVGWNPPLVWRWDGSGFVSYDLPFIGLGGHSLADLDSTGPNDVWAVGGGAPGGGGPFWNQSVIYHFDGQAWEHVPGPLTGLGQTFNDVVALAPDDVWVVGETLNAGSVTPLTQHWDGTAWSNVFTPVGGGGITAIGPDDIWQTGAGFAHWDGSEWSAVEALSCVQAPSVGAIAAVGPCDVWAVGRQVSADLQTLTARLQPRWTETSGTTPSPGAPSLSVHGALSSGTSVRFDVHDAHSDSIAGYVLGFSQINLPFLDGVLVPSPDVVLWTVTDGAGNALNQFPVAASLSGIQLTAQTWIVNPQGTPLATGTNAVTSQM